ncbi:MAG: UbiA family prenyltransferase [Archaeoglobaceae archaeon]
MSGHGEEGEKGDRGGFQEGEDLRELIKFLKFWIEPPTILFPIPLIPLYVVAATGNTIASIPAILYAFLISSASNLWNHTNDAEEDLTFGSRDSRILLKFTKICVVTSIALYTLSYVTVLLFSVDRAAHIFALAPVALTWLYSDRMYLYRLFRFRLKEHYVTELLTYVLTSISALAVLWSFCTELSPSLIVLSLPVILLYLSLAVLKDLKDVTQDEKMGYRTLAIALGPENVLKVSASLAALYYSSLIAAYHFGKLPPFGLLALPAYALFLARMTKKNWKVSVEDVPLMKLYVYQLLTSFALTTASAPLRFS